MHLLSRVSVVQRLKSGGLQNILLASVFLTRTITEICCIYRAPFITCHILTALVQAALVLFVLKRGFPAPGADLCLKLQEGSWALRRSLGTMGPVARPQGVRPGQVSLGAPARQSHSVFSRPCLTALRGGPPVGWARHVPSRLGQNRLSRGLWGCIPEALQTTAAPSTPGPLGPASPGAASC